MLTRPNNMDEKMYAYDYEPPKGDGTKSVWIVDDDRSIRWVLEKALSREGIAYKTFSSAYEVLQAFYERTGCPVVVKGHPAHPGTCALVAGAVQRAVERAGLPAGWFSMVQGARMETPRLSFNSSMMAPMLSTSIATLGAISSWRKWSSMTWAVTLERW